MFEDVNLDGEFFLDEGTRRLYATDASAYRELPEAVVIPKNNSDLVKLVNYANENGKSLIPRTAGTSLAGQVVGSGIVVDISKCFDQILDLNLEEMYVVVQPGIVRDELNRKLAEHGVFFAPETSTANRAMIGGMIGNNSCGSNSVVYGSTREHLLEVKAILADGQQVSFGSQDPNSFLACCNGQSNLGELHNTIYFNTKELLQNQENQNSIKKEYPKKEVVRRNTGYALDMLLDQRPFNKNGDDFNFCQLLAGSEGTLALVTEAKLKLTPLPPIHKALICIHCRSIDESLRANLVALKHGPSACELMDHYILEATKRSPLYSENRFFVEGDPQALLVVEIVRENKVDLKHICDQIIDELKNESLGYSYPVIEGNDIKKVWDLRKAGLGLLSNVPGDDKPVPVIEDTAVTVEELPEYIKEFNEILEKNGLYSVHYAHAGSGELHLRPIINLKTKNGREQFRLIAEEIATLVKKYNGSLSGEHGDGRLRGEFIPQMLGKHNYELCKKVKQTWDPKGVFNPGKIVDTPPMDTSLRYHENQVTPEIETLFDFSEHQGIVRSTELCNGSGDCRKSELSGGTMCPSYMATRSERDTTRARANILREMMTQSGSDPFKSDEIKDILDLCLSCKGCKKECPSNVDMAKLKAEWTYQNHKIKGTPIRTRIIGEFSKGMRLASQFRMAYKALFSLKPTSVLLKSLMGFAQKRSMPDVAKRPLRQWINKEFKPSSEKRIRSIYFFVDEFTNFNDVEVGKKAILLLDKLGYDLKFMEHKESGRSYLSKGMLDQAKSIAQKNVALFTEKMGENDLLVGVEPSTILTFRDEYIELLRGDEQENAKALAEKVRTIEEFLSEENDQGLINSSSFTTQKVAIKIHGHCHQKALSSLTPTKKILSIPANYRPEMIPSGCCGMAGSFGYEKEHFEISMKIGELVLLPAVREADPGTIIAAAGTSCRHQIKDGTGRKALHPVEVLHDALI